MLDEHMIATRKFLFAFWLLIGLGTISAVFAQYPDKPQIHTDGTTVMLEDFASLPLSSPTHGGAKSSSIDYKNQLGRVTSLHSEPADAPLSTSRLFVDDQSGTLYILDKRTKTFSAYLRFSEIFPKFASDTVNSAGIVSFVFDPNYSHNGKFYTIHSEKIDLPGNAAPVNDSIPSLDLRAYKITPTVNPPAGATHFESVLVEWTDTNIRNTSFEGTAREILRTGFESGSSLGDLIFNPSARRRDSDYDNLYISVCDGGQGEHDGPGHSLPQQLNTLAGKILRITPDLNLRTKDALGANGQYRVPTTGPDPNPFVSVPDARPEVYAYGLRNPHRLAWDAVSRTFLVNDIGLHLWEEINVVSKGANFGYAEREGNEQLFVGGPNAGKTGSLTNPPTPFPVPDSLSVTGISAPVIPTYPAAIYTHRDGDAIGSGIVYRGKLMPALRGKYIFNDMTTGRIFYDDLSEMVNTRGARGTQVAIHEIQIMYKKPYAATDRTPEKSRIFDIVAAEFSHKEGTPLPEHVLPGAAAGTAVGKTDPEGRPYTGGRADVRIAVDGDGEVYVLSKSDGMIRKMTSVTLAP
jgi:hypothetical protein